MPYDMIISAEWSSNTGNVTISYKKNKKNDQLSTVTITPGQGNDESVLNYPYDLEDWTAHLQYVLDRYQDFVKLATDDPERHGAVVSKDAFMEAKKRKEAAKNSRTPVAVEEPIFPASPPTPIVSEPVTATPTLPVNYTYFEQQQQDDDEDGDDEYDSDSDDSVEFRPHQKKK
jgi:hypothetical protein